MKSTKIIHPFLFAIFPVLFLYADNIHEVNFSDVIWPLIIVFGVCMLIFFSLTRALRNAYQAAFITTLSFFLFFSYGHIASLFSDGDTILMPLWIVLFFFYTFFTIICWLSFQKLTRIMNFVSIILVSMSLLTIARAKMGPNATSVHGTLSDIVNTFENTIQAKTNEILPDIYYLIFDRYANNSVLQKYYGFDNEDFLSTLRQKGFYIAEQSNANYLTTAHSLASSLNYEYINYFQDTVGKDAQDVTPLHQHLQNSKVTRFLKQQGYTIVHSGSWWEATRVNPFADINIANNAMPEFVFILGKSSFLSLFEVFNFRSEHRNRILSQFEQLENIPDILAPTFTFAHILAPHYPFVFDRDGNFVTLNEVMKKSRQRNYHEQLLYTNQRIERLLDLLLSRSEQKPIIIVQSDEGPYPQRYAVDLLGFQWPEATRDEMKEKMGILNAVYMPNADTSRLYQEMTPVNTFRIIFNEYFDTDYAMLPDRVYVVTDRSHPYNFFEITDEVMIR